MVYSMNHMSTYIRHKLPVQKHPLIYHFYNIIFNMLVLHHLISKLVYFLQHFQKRDTHSKFIFTIAFSICKHSTTYFISSDIYQTSILNKKNINVISFIFNITITSNNYHRYKTSTVDLLLSYNGIRNISNPFQTSPR